MVSLADARALAEHADILERLEHARYAMVDGNTAGVPVSPGVIGRWLDYIAHGPEEVLNG